MRTRDYGQSKPCEQCGRIFWRPSNLTGHQQWAKKRYCSHACSVDATRRTPAEAFADKWMPEPNTGCWLWTGAATAEGYGQLRVNRMTKYAHRISYELHVGPIPDGGVVCHRCDTPFCVNPNHLFLGSYSDNTQDMLGKGRHVTKRKLSDDDVAAIRASSEMGKALAARYGVAASTISLIRNEKVRP